MNNAVEKLIENIPSDWSEILKPEFSKKYFAELANFLDEEINNQVIFPPKSQIFEALKFSSYKSTKVLILGQDPYHDYNQAHGLSFSVKKGIKIPPSLRNIYKELKNDLGLEIPSHGYLKKWANQGVLMINSVLTVRAHIANSHKKKGWEIFTDAIISEINKKNTPVVFILWGNYAQEKQALIDLKKHKIISSVHPSPLSASRGFFNSKPFSQINDFLTSNKKNSIDWDLNDNTIVQPSLF